MSFKCVLVYTYVEHGQIDSDCDTLTRGPAGTAAKLGGVSIDLYLPTVAASSSLPPAIYSSAFALVSVTHSC